MALFDPMAVLTGVANGTLWPPSSDVKPRSQSRLFVLCGLLNDLANVLYVIVNRQYRGRDHEVANADGKAEVHAEQNCR